MCKLLMERVTRFRSLSMMDDFALVMTPGEVNGYEALLTHLLLKIDIPAHLSAFK